MALKIVNAEAVRGFSWRAVWGEQGEWEADEDRGRGELRMYSSDGAGEKGRRVFATAFSFEGERGGAGDEVAMLISSRIVKMLDMGEGTLAAGGASPCRGVAGSAPSDMALSTAR